MSEDVLSAERMDKNRVGWSPAGDESWQNFLRTDLYKNITKYIIINLLTNKYPVSSQLNVHHLDFLPLWEPLVS